MLDGISDGNFEVFFESRTEGVLDGTADGLLDVKSEDFMAAY